MGRSCARRAALVGSLVLSGLTVLLAGSLAGKAHGWDFRQRGIVLEQRADVLNGPGSGIVAVRTIHEGMKARVYASANGWYQISLPNGWNGWLRKRPSAFLE